MPRSVSAGTAFQKFSIASTLAATVALFALGGSALLDGSRPAPEPIAEQPVAAASAAVSTPVAPSQAETKPAPPVAITFGDGLEKPQRVLLAGSTGKLQDLFKRIGYELDGVRARGEVPRIFLASLPHDLKKLPRAAQRKVTFIKSTLPLILHVNELIEQERARIVALRDRVRDGYVLAPEDTAWLADTADRYGVDSLDFDVLLTRVDIVPPSLAIAQAAEESGWGTSRFAREGNALFGQRAYRSHRKGIVPKARAAGKTFRVRAFDHLIDGVKAYAHNLNSHFAYEDFRARRAALRNETGAVDGYMLAGSLVRYSERGADYIKTIRTIMRVNALHLFDSARLRDTLDGRAEPPDA